MQASDSLQRMYEDLANRFAREGEARHRDHCLVLAADAALRAGQLDQAERLRKRLLLTNPHHLLRPYNSMTEAMQSSDVEDYVDDLRRHWPPETVEKLLRQSLSLADQDVPLLEEHEEKMERRKMSESPARKTVKELIKPQATEKQTTLTLGEDDLHSSQAAPTVAPPAAAPSAARAESKLAMLVFVFGLVAAIGLLVLVFGAPLWQ